MVLAGLGPVLPVTGVMEAGGPEDAVPAVKRVALPARWNAAMWLLSPFQLAHLLFLSPPGTGGHLRRGGASAAPLRPLLPSRLRLFIPNGP